MKKRIYPRRAAAYLATAAILCGLCAVPLASQTKPKNILDYYLALPDEYFKCELSPSITRAYKEKLIVRKNIRNGYIQARSEGYPMEVALFTDDYLKLSMIAVVIRCGEGCMCNRFAVLSLAGNGAWSDNTSHVFPTEKQIAAALKKPDTVYEFLLPEVGTDIKVVDTATKKVLLTIGWSGGMFQIK